MLQFHLNAKAKKNGLNRWAELQRRWDESQLTVCIVSRFTRRY